MLMNVAIVSGQRCRLDGSEGTKAASMRPRVFVTCATMVVEASALCERFAAFGTGVGLVPRMYSRVGLQCRRLTECFAADFAAVRPLSIMLATVAYHGGFVAKPFLTDGTLVRFLPRMLPIMIVKVDARLERFVARRASEVSNIFMV